VIIKYREEYGSKKKIYFSFLKNFPHYFNPIRLSNKFSQRLMKKKSYLIQTDELIYSKIIEDFV